MTKLNKRKYRELVKDQFTPSLRYFFTDFLITYAIMVAATIYWMVGPQGYQWLGYIVAVFAVYHAFLFVHDNVHLPKKDFAVFTQVWDVMAGSLFMMPTFMYESHMDHHIPKKYGTIKDPEYLVLAGKSPLRLLAFLLEHMFVIPIVIYLRMTLGLPIRLLNKKLSNTLDERVSALVINWSYTRAKKLNPGKIIRLEASALVITSALIYLTMIDVVNPVYIGKGIAILIGALFINGVRTLAAHRYANYDLRELNETEQLIDSLNYVGPAWIGLLVAPIGLRYHALHHLFPTIPYHNLHKAHNIIMANIDDDDPYHQTCFNSYLGHIFKMPNDTEGLVISE